ncbi:hypothetical protein B0T20DRAFT_405336 [Sordaria brevicollis]|uniref:Uncharacterized protein n=1 Tax=Sordaria brevicollis TaxID=83679 RepID=A0AAE0UE58_SORBR|nr:hypothetical protein B0T20DRAFT_405336 [Sordaria brevicollis]
MKGGTTPTRSQELRRSAGRRRIAFSTYMCVVIRRGPHAKTNTHAANGTVLTAWNERTGTYTNVTTEDDPHITVYLGWSLDELCWTHMYTALGTPKRYST